MGIAETRREQMFPCLTDAQIGVARRFSSDGPREFVPNEWAPLTQLRSMR